MRRTHTYHSPRPPSSPTHQLFVNTLCKFHISRWRIWRKPGLCRIGRNASQRQAASCSWVLPSGSFSLPSRSALALRRPEPAASHRRPSSKSRSHHVETPSHRGTGPPSSFTNKPRGTTPWCRGSRTCCRPSRELRLRTWSLPWSSSSTSRERTCLGWRRTPRGSCPHRGGAPLATLRRRWRARKATVSEGVKRAALRPRLRRRLPQTS